jgi:hypothetical protein
MRERGHYSNPGLGALLTVGPSQEACKEFCDKYVECDAVIIFIDMLLHKPEVYRHLLFNRQVEKVDSGLRVPDASFAREAD